MTDMQITINGLKQYYGVTVELGKYSPGDGWTRYSVSINGWQGIKEGMNKAECYAYLRGIFDMLRVQEDDVKRAQIA